MRLKTLTKFNCICIALNHRYSLKGHNRPYIYDNVGRLSLASRVIPHKYIQTKTHMDAWKELATSLLAETVVNKPHTTR